MDYKKTASGRINPYPSPSAHTPVLLKNFIRPDVHNNLFITRLNEKNELGLDRKSTRLNSSHIPLSRMPSSA